MPCDRRLKPRQTISQRAAEIRAATERLSAALVAGRVQVKIGANGVPVFTGWDDHQITRTNYETQPGESQLLASKRV